MSGDGYSSPVVGGDGALIRDDIRSRDYSPGTAGWAIFADPGFAEFLNLTVRGEFSTGPPGESRVRIAEDALGAFIELYSGDPQEVSSAFLFSYTDPVSANHSAMNIGSNDDGHGQLELTFFAPVDNSWPGIWSFTQDVDATITAHALIRVENTVKLVLFAVGDATLAGTTHPLQIGDNNTPNLRFDRQGMQAVNAGVAAPLRLNAAGGGLTCPAMRHLDALDGSSRSTSSTSYVTASTVANFTFPCPGSEIFTVAVSGRLNISTGATADAACLGFEVRAGSSTGTVLFAAHDNNAAIVRQVPEPQSASRIRTVDLTGVAGVAPGNTLWISAMLRSNSGANTATMQQVTLVVMPSP